MPKLAGFLCVLISLTLGSCGENESQATTSPVSKSYTVAGTGQTQCYNNSVAIPCPSRGQDFFGQDATIPSTALKYQTNGDGTVTDLTTGLMWTKALSPKSDWASAMAAAREVSVGGYSDWRLPDVKELYSLMNYRGHFSIDALSSIPFIDTNFFEFSYLPEAPSSSGGPGQRFLDVQLWSSSKYVAATMGGDPTIFGVNFADGRIKGYPQFEPGSGGQRPAQMLARYVRGKLYGWNNLKDNGDGSTSDLASGLTWQTVDDGVIRNWKNALQYCATLNLSGQQDWRLPNAKELHTIVDYTRSPSTSNSSAITPPLKTSTIESYYWTSNTLLDGPDQVKSTKAAYFTFGRALGWMAIPPTATSKALIDVHGAGAQRTDPKEGDPAQFPQGFGPQGDDVRIYNYVRCVRGER
jgi:Protein of unknown function (DUF1566)